MLLTKDNYLELKLPGFYPFVDKPIKFDSEESDNIALLRKINNKEKIDWMKYKTKFEELWHPDSYKSGIYKIGGWVFNFGRYWNTYFVKYKDESSLIIQSAPNKSFIRKMSTHPGRILRITKAIDFRKVNDCLKQLKNSLVKVLSGTMKKDEYYNIINEIRTELKG